MCLVFFRNSFILLSRKEPDMSNLAEEARDTDIYLERFYARRNKYFWKVLVGATLLGFFCVYILQQLLPLDVVVVISVIVGVETSEILYKRFITIPAKREAWGPPPYTGWKAKYSD